MDLFFERDPYRNADLPDRDSADLARRLSSTLRLGTVADADYEKARVRITIGKVKTGWLPWVTLRAGSDITWWAPELGEQVLVLAPCGNLAQAVVLAALYQDAHPAPAASADVSTMQWKDGTTVIYNRAAHKLTVACAGEVDVTAATKVTVTSPEIALVGHVAVQGDVDVAGSVNASGSIVDGAGNTNHHSHP
jgi:phage baseplate assembly protein V